MSFTIGLFEGRKGGGGRTTQDLPTALCRAEMRMADEIDAGPSAQGRRSDIPRDSGEVIPTLPEIGVDDRRFAEWRDTRDAGQARSAAGAIRRVISAGGRELFAGVAARTVLEQMRGVS
jgi:hypothetical protein